MGIGIICQHQKACLLPTWGSNIPPVSPPLSTQGLAIAGCPLWKRPGGYPLQRRVYIWIIGFIDVSLGCRPFAGSRLPIPLAWLILEVWHAATGAPLADSVAAALTWLLSLEVACSTYLSLISSGEWSGGVLTVGPSKVPHYYIV